MKEMAVHDWPTSSTGSLRSCRAARERRKVRASGCSPPVTSTKRRTADYLVIHTVLSTWHTWVFPLSTVVLKYCGTAVCRRLYSVHTRRTPYCTRATLWIFVRSVPHRCGSRIPDRAVVRRASCGPSSPRAPASGPSGSVRLQSPSLRTVRSGLAHLTSL